MQVLITKEFEETAALVARVFLPFSPPHTHKKELSHVTPVPDPPPSLELPPPLERDTDRDEVLPLRQQHTFNSRTVRELRNIDMHLDASETMIPLQVKTLKLDLFTMTHHRRAERLITAYLQMIRSPPSPDIASYLVHPAREKYGCATASIAYALFNYLDLKASHTVLDMGCGNGAMSHVANLVFGASVLGIDPKDVRANTASAVHRELLTKGALVDALGFSAADMHKKAADNDNDDQDTFEAAIPILYPLLAPCVFHRVTAEHLHSQQFAKANVILVGPEAASSVGRYKIGTLLARCTQPSTHILSPYPLTTHSSEAAKRLILTTILFLPDKIQQMEPQTLLTSLDGTISLVPTPLGPPANYDEEDEAAYAAVSRATCGRWYHYISIASE